MDKPATKAEYFVLAKEPPKQVPCQQACPIGIDIPRYLRLIAEGRFAEAAPVIREKNPFPSICGRVCFRPCELHCPVAQVDGAVTIRALERFAAQQDTGLWKPKAKASKATGKKVAIVGSGPAGLAAAYYLAKQGHAVTVFESGSQAGGMLRWGVPGFILPQDILQQEINAILGLGVELRLNNPVEKVSELVDDYHAVFLAIGAQEGQKLSISGADLEGVFIGLSILQDVSQGKEVKLGKKVLVLGGGGVACDVARTARRLGAPDVRIACLESRQCMPAYPWEREAAEAEGVIIHPSCTFTKIRGDGGHVSGVECVNLRWMKFDEEGGLHMDTVEGSQHVLEADTVIFTIGQGINPAIVADVPQIRITKRCTIVADPQTMETGYPGVFAGGDAVSGPASVAEAIAAGRKAAISIDRYLGGTGNIDEVLSAPEGVVAPWEPVSAPADRIPAPMLPLEQRLAGFAETELSLEEKAAIEQAQRCLRCDLPIMVYGLKCSGCLACQLRCSFRWEKAFNLSKAYIKVRRLFQDDVQYALSFTDQCDGCGVCVRYCAYGALTREKVPTGRSRRRTSRKERR